MKTNHPIARSLIRPLLCLVVVLGLVLDRDSFAGSQARGGRDVIGTASFTPAGGGITNLALAGVVTDVTYDVTGRYFVVLTGLVDAEYSVTVSAQGSVGPKQRVAVVERNAQTSSGLTLNLFDESGTPSDDSRITIVVMRKL